MNAGELTAYLGRIRDATNVPMLADVALELTTAHADDRATASRLLAIVAIKWKRIERSN